MSYPKPVAPPRVIAFSPRPRYRWLERILRARSVNRIRKLRRQVATAKALIGIKSESLYKLEEEYSELESTRNQFANRIHELTQLSLQHKQHISELESEVEISKKQVEQLTLVVLRDRERVLAETQILVQLKDGNREVVSPTGIMARRLTTGNGIDHG